MIVAVYRKNTPNRGDLASTPVAYFNSSINTKRLDILDCSSDNEVAVHLLNNAATIILGGGGLLGHKKFSLQINYILNNFGDKVIIWGAGSNFVSEDPTSVDLSKARLVGIRDYGPTNHFSWVPCVSCMNPEIDLFLGGTTPHIGKPIGILENNAGARIARVGDCGVSDVARFGNKKVSSYEMLQFISSCSLLVTSSYHAAFWATLLSIPVLGVPTSSKFANFRHMVKLVKKDDWANHVGDALVHPEALAECRIANLQFLANAQEIFPSLCKVRFVSSTKKSLIRSIFGIA